MHKDELARMVAAWLAALDAANVLGGSSLFDASAVFGDDLVAWYSVKDTSTLFQDSAGTTPAGIGDPVGRWADKSGNGHHLTQATTAAKPQLTADGILTDGTDDYMTVDFGQTLAQPLTHILVGRDLLTSASSYWYDGINGADRNAFLHFSGAAHGLFAGTSLNAGTRVGTRSIYTAIFDGVNSLLRVDQAQAASGDAGTQPLTGITLAARYTIEAFLNCRVWEMVVVNARATTQQIETAESQLAAQYGITL